MMPELRSRLLAIIERHNESAPPTQAVIGALVHTLQRLQDTLGTLYDSETANAAALRARLDEDGRLLRTLLELPDMRNARLQALREHAQRQAALVAALLAALEP